MSLLCSTAKALIPGENLNGFMLCAVLSLLTHSRSISSIEEISGRWRVAVESLNKNEDDKQVLHTQKMIIRAGRSFFTEC
jgi:hypothetical protein